MKLLTLTVTNVENVNAEYDFASGNVHSPQDAIRFLEYTLFGNEVIFSGKTVLTVEQDEENVIKIERDFADGVSVYKNDEKLNETRAANMLEKIAGLKHNQWVENVRPVNSEEVLSDLSSFIKKYLSELGFDGEELEKRWDFYYKDHSLFVSKVEAYDELVDDAYIKIAADRKEKMLALQEKLDAVTHIKQSAEEKGLLISLKQSLSEKKAALTERDGDIAEKKHILEEDDALIKKIAALAEIKETKAEADKAYAELDATIAEMEELQKAITELEEKLSEKATEAQENSERAVGLMESFEDILQSNLDDKELTNAVISKTEDVIPSFDGEGASGLAAELQKAHLDFRKQRAIREGVAFENSFENSEVRIADLNAKIEQNTALMDRIKREIADTENMLVRKTEEATKENEVAAAENETEEAATEENVEAAQNKEEPTLGTHLPCDDKSLDVYEAKVTARNLEKQITAEESKIRELLKIRKTLLEDLAALKKAKVAQEEYVRRLEKKKGKLDEKLLVSKSRIAFNGNKEKMEIGDACPVCNSRIVNKQNVAEELNKLGEGYQKLATECAENDASLEAAKTKLADINIRLTRLNERIAFGVNTINGLTDSVNEKQAKLSSILAERGVKTVADLERKYRSMPLLLTGGDGIALQEHISFLKAELEAVAATIEEDKQSISEEQERLNAMKADYEEAILPELDGQPALEKLDEIVASDKNEDMIIAELNGEIPLGDTTVSAENGNAEIYVNVTAEIFADVMEEIKKSETGRAEAEKDGDAIRAELEEKRTQLAVKVTVADEIKEKADNLASLVYPALEEMSCTAEDLESSDRLSKKLMSEEEKARLKTEVKKYEKELSALDIQISALDGYGEVEFDGDEYAELREAAEQAEKSYRKAATRLAVSEAAKDLAIEKAAMCGELTVKMELVKKLSDGEIFEVTMPVINDFLTMAETNLEAVPAGNAVEFIDTRKGKKVAVQNVDKATLDVLTDCVINNVMSLSSGEQTMRFALVGNKNESLRAPAEKYGVIIL